MSRQIFFNIAIAIIVAFSLTSTASAQLKPSGNSGNVWIDLNVIETADPKSLFHHRSSKINSNGTLLKPPRKMPISSYLNRHPATKNSSRPVRIKSKSYTNSSNKYYKTRKLSDRTKKLKSDKNLLKSKKFKTKTVKPNKQMKSAVTQTPKKPTKLAPTLAKELGVDKQASAPVPKAVPLAPVKILKIAPPTPEIEKAITKTASISPKLASRSDKTLQKESNNLLIFKQGNAQLSSKAKKALDDISVKLRSDEKSRMQIKAYAGEPSLSSSKARRLSLSRALSVRSYLIKKGIRSTRIDVRALGNKTLDGEPNRVDLKIIKN